MKHPLSLIWLSALLLCAFAPLQTETGRVMMEMESKVLNEGKVSTTKAEIFFMPDGKMITRSSLPRELFTVSNAKGVVHIYDPANNSVAELSDAAFSTENSQVSMFLRNKKSDLGLKSMGFSLHETKMVQGNIVTLWLPPASLKKLFQKIHLVHQGPNPIYMGYFDTTGREIKKVFYADYQQLPSVAFPGKITQMDYLPDGDSIITRTVYKNIRTGQQAQSPYFTFQIPAEARLIRQK